MPELPDITTYLEALELRVLGQPLQRIQIGSLFLLRTVVPPISAIQGRKVSALRRIGKRIVFGFEGDLWLVLHLMIAGRLHWHPVGEKTKGRSGLAALDFPNGTLTLTEAGTKRRASLHLIQGEDQLKAIDPGGIDVLGCTRDEFSKALVSENHTLKRSLTDPHLFSGIGNAYSDEILHEAKLSPVQLTKKLTPDELTRLYHAVRLVLRKWIDLLRKETGAGFPEKVTAFRPEMAVHGKFGKPCPVCGTTVQRIRYADNETNYCPTCQTGGRVLADRSLSRLLKEDWPKTAEEWETKIPRASPEA
ncbi:MAG TPA: DNA-formamidopyrimidine glycosylase family protein [Opitutaceae bacterium]|nr:DNA-formamidopyrimidine glycosylase family protein [Opitutaceae bacterium]